MPYCVLSTKSDVQALFTTPFLPKKCVYARNSELFEEGNAACNVEQKQLAIDVDEEDLLHKTIPQFICGESGCRASFNSVYAYEIHYRSAHSHVCTECKRVFPSLALLDIHIEDKHDSYHKSSQEKNLSSYTCPIGGCAETFLCPLKRKEHMVTDHKHPSNFKFSKLPSTKRDNEIMDTSDTALSACADAKKKNPQRYIPQVPHAICFGRGSTRGFQRSNRKNNKTRTFTQRSKQPSVGTNCTEDISMKELHDAL